jgi:hypothetical protein
MGFGNATFLMRTEISKRLNCTFKRYVTMGVTVKNTAAKDHNQLLKLGKTVAWLTFPFFAGFYVSIALSLIPSGGGLLSVPMNPLVPLVLFASIIMLYSLLSSFRNSKILSIKTITLICGCTTIVYLTATDTPTAVTYNVTIMNLLTLSVYFIAVLPFFFKRTIISFEQSKAKKHSISLATSVMWLSPFLADMLVLLRWHVSGELERLSYMVLGGAGTNDILFFYGFWLLVSMSFFHLFGRVLFKASDQNSAHREHL